MLKIETFVFNPFRENTYIIYDDSQECAIIDNGAYTQDETNALYQFIESKKIKPVLVLNTHCHIDHVLGNYNFNQKFGLIPKYHKEDDFLIDTIQEYGRMFGIKVGEVIHTNHFIEEYDVIEFGNTKLKTFHVPGHSPGHVVFYSEKDKSLFCGDVLFRNSIGRTDLPGGSYEQLINELKAKVMTLPDETIVYSGHGENTTIGYERVHNSFVRD